MRQWLDRGSLAPLWRGSVVLHHRGEAPRPWFAAWEFAHLGRTWHAVLAGDGLYQLRPGTAEFPRAAVGSSPLKDLLLASRSPGERPMDFRVTLQKTDGAITFSAGSGTDGVPESLRKLGSLLGVDPSGRSFGFDHVISAVLQRGIVLTDNRRLPLRRRFSLAELRRSAD